MILSNYLAEVWGISLVVCCLALIIRESYLKHLFRTIEIEGHLMMWGFISFIIGICMVLPHNVWVKNWQVVITIFAWIELIKGLSIIFFPECVKACVKKMENQKWLPILLLVGVFVGLALTYLGFKA